MESSAPTSERDRVAQRSGVVFVLAVTAAGLALFAGFGIAMAACAHSVSDLSGLLQFPAPDAVRPVPIPKTACPYLRLVAVAATNAGAPWHDAFQPSTDWKHFAGELSAPLAALDVALAAAVPHVPDPVARDLVAVQHDVHVGRAELLTSTSVNDYLARSQVLSGYGTLGHASALVGSACGFTLAPPLPF
ncbi:MAG: hypothetical protein E6G39_01745 [Actinobacteria bacterium]|nr:MAG: hypothetical protein E6G39_01745 [Actinomycetota bacterium]